MLITIVITGILLVLYAVLIGFYNKSWRGFRDFKNSDAMPGPRFSIIIPARNEADTIGALLQSIQQQAYPENCYEVIVVDDHSDDATATIASACKNVRVIQLTGAISNAQKKKAIEAGIGAAAHEWIICTDADCLVPAYWLQTYAAYISDANPVFIAAPVSFTNGKGVLHFFQELDFLVLQGITAASVHKKIHSMCNGANLAYRRDVFYEVDGFKGIDHIASGDDMLLMHKIWQRYPDRVLYLKSGDAIVQTAAADSWRAFMNQRIRWASKATSYDDKRIFGVLLLVYLFNFSFLVLLTASLFNIHFLWLFLALWILKTIVEWPFVSAVALFFSKQRLLRYFFFFQPMHMLYTIIAGFLGAFGKYEWKGRRVK